eukprot:TRINITY_DN15116_c0_g1_i2.p1 TRINITY_DN15116_c0_g1~~TRINITY_DN15116_c0_g1_i2.p1  ORF type:complete len:537 (+),score=167.44 TRINITY_DN15116_c0_g1_i2:60-1670(+)
MRARAGRDGVVVPAAVLAAVDTRHLIGVVEVRAEAAAGADGVTIPVGHALSVVPRVAKGSEPSLELRISSRGTGAFLGTVGRCTDSTVVVPVVAGLIQCTAWAARRQAVTRGGVLRVLVAVSVTEARPGGTGSSSVRTATTRLLRRLCGEAPAEPTASQCIDGDDVIDLVSDGEEEQPKAEDTVRALLAESEAAPAAEVAQPPHVRTPLHPHQLAGMGWMADREAGSTALFDSHPLYTKYELTDRLLSPPTEAQGRGPGTVTAASGVVVRESEAIDSPVVSRLPQSTRIEVAAVKDRRALVINPVSGWCSVRSRDGRDNVVMDGVGDPEPLPLFGGGVVWCNQATGEMRAVAPPPPPPPRGGILADEMGLGKTLQMLALIARGCAAADPGLMEPSAKRRRQTDVLRDADRRFLPDAPTLVVAPLSLVSHWRDEAARHYSPGTLRVHCYHGTARVTAPELLGFDVVLTTYALLALEWKRTEKGEPSPLYSVEWSRVILDEAHSVREATTGCSVAVANLPGAALTGALDVRSLVLGGR